MSQSENDFPIPHFWERSYWEPAVTIALPDYCRPGNTVFDIGANAGALSALMSRYVGPTGRVLSFEASPRIIHRTQRNLVEHGCSNVHLFFRAVYKKSHETVTLFPGTHLNDSIYMDYGAENGAQYKVETVALDDVVAETSLIPSFMKLDIEGAEFDALEGGLKTIELYQPSMILEQSQSDSRCFDLLTSLGYLATDLSTYRRIYTTDDFTAGTGIMNIVFVHKTKANGDPYINATTPRVVADLGPELFAVLPDGSIQLKEKINLPPGRYICEALFTADGDENEIFAGIESNSGLLCRYHTYTRLMAQSYRSWIFHLTSEQAVSPAIKFLKGTDPTLNWRGARVSVIESFSALRQSVIF